MPDLDLYDSINTIAARWLEKKKKTRELPLGIKKFERKNKIHLWLLHIMSVFSVAAGYEDFYIDCSWFDYFYIRCIKKINHARKMKRKTNAFLIEPELFAKEVCEKFARSSEDVKYIYDTYWGK